MARVPRTVSGSGRVYSFTIAHVATAPHFRDEVPQIIAVVELDEGPRLTTTLIGVAPERVRVGMRVRPVFDDIPGHSVTLLRYAEDTERKDI